MTNQQKLAEDIKIHSAFYNPTTTIAHIDTGISEEDAKQLFEEMFKEAKPSFFKLTCQNCGASVEQKLDDHLFKCPYCKSAYFIGTELIRAS